MIFLNFHSVQLTKQMVWNDDLLDPESDEFSNRKKEIEEEVIMFLPLDT